MNIRDLQREAHAIAKDKGWWDEERNFGDLIALVHSELSEALEAYREWGLAGSLEVLRRTLSPRYATPEESEEDVECWNILDEDTDRWDLWEFAEYAMQCKPEGVASELADVVIRVADMAEWYGYDLSIAEEKKPFDYFEPSALTFGSRIAMLHEMVAEAFRHEGSEILVEDALATLVAGVQHMAAHYGIDLDAAIEAKLEYNRGRSYRHGGKTL